MIDRVDNRIPLVALGLDMGVYSAKAVLIEDGIISRFSYPIAGKAVEAARICIEKLLEGKSYNRLKFGIMGQNARLVADQLDLDPLLEIEALQSGLSYQQIKADYVLSLGHENMYYLELDPVGQVVFFSRNGQCAAGSGSFWYQQATRMGYNDRELASIAMKAEHSVPISGRCAVFAKSDMTHAINEGAAQGAVAAGMAEALVENVIATIARNRIRGPGLMVAVGGVANNSAVFTYLQKHLKPESVSCLVPKHHEYLNAIGAAVSGNETNFSLAKIKNMFTAKYIPQNPRPALEPEKVSYLSPPNKQYHHDFRKIYLGVDCGSVSTKCVLLDNKGQHIGGIYLPTSGRPALQVLELIKKVDQEYGSFCGDTDIIACTTGSGRFLSQKILNAEYAVDEITCQAEAIKYLFNNENSLSIIEIGGEDSKFIQLENGILADYNMNPVCAAGTGTFLENLAELLGINIKDEFSRRAFSAKYAVDLGDICTLISQSILVSASAGGLPLNEQLCSLAYSSAQNYLSKTVDRRTLKGKLIFTGATAHNHALAAALSAVAEKEIHVPANPELTGALGSALMARQFDRQGIKGQYSFRKLSGIKGFDQKINQCRADCRHEHKCMLNVISFTDGEKFIYGDRCGRYSSREKPKENLTSPDYVSMRNEIMKAHMPDENIDGPRVGIASSGLFYEYFPFWSNFFRDLGARIVCSPESNSDILLSGKMKLDSEMCYPMKVIVGHYQKLIETDLDYLFIPEVVDMEALPWAEEWPRSFVCPLLQTIRRTIENSLNLDPDQILYSQLNYRTGYPGLKKQLEPLAKVLLGENFNEVRLEKALKSAYSSQQNFKLAVADQGKRILDELISNPDPTTAVFLGRSYTVYDHFIAKNSTLYARENDITVIPHDYLLSLLQAWYEKKMDYPLFETFRSELETKIKEQVDCLDNIYPAQLQRIISVVILINFLNKRTRLTGLPVINMVLLDPFKCGPNAMLRHYLNEMTGYLRLTLDEHTAAAGIITRLEAYKNTCLSRTSIELPENHFTAVNSVCSNNWDKILVPSPTRHGDVIAAGFRSYGIDAEVLDCSSRDLSLAQQLTNGEECLPFIQNIQDFLQYQVKSDNDPKNNEVFFQGWACGPCRYGLYAPIQSMIINRAGFGEQKVCAVKLSDANRRFGIGYAVWLFNGMLGMDLLYKMLHRVRPYELDKGSADKVFDFYADQMISLIERSKLKKSALITGSYRKPIERLLAEAANTFDNIPLTDTKKPIILVGGEFYVRLDSRSNQSVISKIEQAGGEVCFAPVTEVFTYTIYIDYLEAKSTFSTSKRYQDLLKQIGSALILRLALRDEDAMEKAAAQLLHELEEPKPQEIMARASSYVSRHYGGEPPMTIGRTAAFADRERVAGALFVAPFTCMPGSVVEAQQKALQEELGIPIVTVYYDGRDDTGRDEIVEGLVYQARQKIL